MTSFITKSIISFVIVVFFISALVFLLIHLIPGDPVLVILGEFATPADMASLRAKLGLDKPIFEQFIIYYKNLLKGSFGQSLIYDKEVIELVSERFSYTVTLAVFSIIVAILISLPLGSVAAYKHNTFIDKIAMLFSLVGLSIPNFLLGPLLILIFTFYLGLVPVSGVSFNNLSTWILPSLTLGTALAAILSRILRSSLLEVLSSDYIRTAKAKGLPRLSVMKHAIRNSLLPYVTVLGLQIGTLLGGAVITEIVFSIPGIGSLLIESISNRDYPVVQAIVLIIAVAYTGINTFTEIVYAMIDPVIRLE